MSLVKLEFLLRKEFAPRGSKFSGSEFFPLRAVPCGMGNNFHHIRGAPLSVTFFITHMHILHNGSYANDVDKIHRDWNTVMTVTIIHPKYPSS